jgi:hypothetical protein
MADEQGDEGTGGRPAQSPFAMPPGLFPGLAWSEAMFEAPVRAQAALAADTLRKLNAPVLEGLEAQRKLADALASAAEQTADVARLVEGLARQHAAAAEQLQSALEPYLRYVEWLGRLGALGAARAPDD